MSCERESVNNCKVVWLYMIRCSFNKKVIIKSKSLSWSTKKVTKHYLTITKWVDFGEKILIPTLKVLVLVC